MMQSMCNVDFFVIFIFAFLTFECVAKVNDYMNSEDLADSFPNLSGNDEVSICFIL